jgi:hypothetical protein
MHPTTPVVAGKSKPSQRCAKDFTPHIELSFKKIGYKNQLTNQRETHKNQGISTDPPLLSRSGLVIDELVYMFLDIEGATFRARVGLGKRIGRIARE